MSFPFQPRRAAAIAHKELRHMMRDALSMKVLMTFPLLLVCFFGYAITFEVRNVDVLVQDGDRTRASRVLADMLDKSGYFRVRPTSSILDAERALGDDAAKAVIMIPPQFQRNLLIGRPVRAQVLLDGSDDQMASLVTGYLATLERAAQRRLGRSAPSGGPLRTRFIFNSELESRWFVIPALFAVVGVFAILLPALTISREWETGSMELLLATPARALDILLGKLAPHFAFSAAQSVVIFALVRALFGVPFLGSAAAMVAGTTLFLMACVAQGLLISELTRAQRLSYQWTMQTGNWPIQLLSGFLYPVQNMPVLVQWLVCLLPARWYVSLLRSVFLRGAGVADVAAPIGALAGLTAVLTALSWAKFKMDLEP